MASTANAEQIITYARKTFVALKNPCHSVEKVFPEALDAFAEEAAENVRFVGAKNRVEVPRSLLQKLRRAGYRLHTLDAASAGGRAVDLQLMNPISGKPMTGSSSGTAINVRLGINDLGIGTDGGGSVLAPAMSVNLYGLISGLIEPEYLAQFSKKSTDGIGFSPSLGFMARSYGELLRAVNAVLKLPQPAGPTRVVVPAVGDEEIAQHLPKDAVVKQVAYPDIFKARQPLLDFLRQQLDDCDVLLSYEGPVDYEGFGDTVLGHLGQRTAIDQQHAKKGLLRVANMVNATALVVPGAEFASGYLLLCESTPQKVSKLLQLAAGFAGQEDALLAEYFTRFTAYFPREYGMGE